MKWFMLGENYERVEDIQEAIYVYVAKGYLDEFAGFLQGETLDYSTLVEEGWNYWSDEHWCFEKLENREDLNEFLPSELKVCEITKTNKENKFNLYIELYNEDRIHVNEEPCTLDEIMEAIRVLQKPSMFGKQVKEYKIIRIEE